MTHELRQIFDAYERSLGEGISAVLATVVALEGSSYRKPGVRMLLLEDGRDFGAVSGGCVEREIHRQAASVFRTGQPRMMTYDGRYRLGCEGILHILLEPFEPREDVREAFRARVRSREAFGCISHYRLQDGESTALGSLLQIDGKSFPLRPDFQPDSDTLIFNQSLDPCMRLVIFGGEHDAVELCKMAAGLGWEVFVVVAMDEQKTLVNFPGASSLKAVIPEDAPVDFVDPGSAVVVMTHSYVKDLKYLGRLRDSRPGYLGLLGPALRRERLLDDLMERHPDLDPAFMDLLHGPAGLDIGAESAQEIALSVLSEILSVFRATTPQPLREKSGPIHEGR